MPQFLSDEVFEWFARALPSLFDGGYCPRCSGTLTLNKQLVLQLWDMKGGPNANVNVSVAPAAKVACVDCGLIHFFDLATIQKRHAEAKANPGEVIPFGGPKSV